jgi:hypothetical protein
MIRIITILSPLNPAHTAFSGYTDEVVGDFLPELISDEEVLVVEAVDKEACDAFWRAYGAAIAAQFPIIRR